MKVAVVGAGIGGLFTAWRLLRSGKHDVTVYEGSDRIGGRLLTWFPHGADHTVRGELGGMRFIPEQHKMVAQVVKELNLKPVQFPATTQFAYLRGDRLTDYTRVPYNLKPGEEGKSPADLLKDVITEVAVHNGIADAFKLTRQEWDQMKPRLMWKGQLLSTIGFWNLMLDIVSDEAYNYMTDGLGYYSLTSNWNAAEALQFIATDFASDDYYTLMEGYSALATTMANQIAGCIELNHKVSSLDRVGAQWQLTFENGATTTADCVVLGLPGRAMELVGFPDDVQQKLGELQAALMRIPAFKLFLLYDQNWWTYGPGRLTTTLPIRQTYNFNVVPNQSQLMAMASYDDLTAVPYWHGLEHAESAQPFQAGARELFHPHRFSGLLKEREATEVPVGFKVAPPGMVARAQAQLAEAVGKQIPAPHASAYMDWTQDPYGGAWSFWAPGANVARVMQETRYLSDSLFVVGDSFSGIQGWVEGALTYAEKLLQEKFELPAYLPGYYLGH